MGINETYHILVIDDNEDNLFIFKVMLEIKGYIVSVRDNFINIENEIKLIRPQLILMDMLLSGADGRDITRKIKENLGIDEIPIIMIAALPDAAYSCMAAGANYFLGKLFEMNELFKTISTALSVVNKNKLTAI